MRFNNADDLEDVLQGPVPMGTPFYLLWRRWRRQSMAAAGSLKYKVLIGLKGMPAHIRGIHSAPRILGTSCANLVPAPASAAGEDLREFVVAAWCVHPDFIPHERLIAIPEPEMPFVVEPTLYLREHEVIHSELPVLQYGVRIRIIEVQDWTAPPSSSDDAPGDSDDNNHPDWDFGGGRSGHWPRRHRFSNGDGGGDGTGTGEGAAPDPMLGTFSVAAAAALGHVVCQGASVTVGNVVCPILHGHPKPRSTGGMGFLCSNVPPSLVCRWYHAWGNGGVRRCSSYVVFFLLRRDGVVTPVVHHLDAICNAPGCY